ncbi:MAG TPA: TIM barrel protein [Vicinamibacterales bacterium]|jgi:sugar phosphate isomerase/epimerase
MYTRREFGMVTLGGFALPSALTALIDSTIAGVRIGVQSYSFRALPRPADRDPGDVLINAIVECGLGDCELFAPQVEPVMAPGAGRGTPEAQKGREDLRRWRTTTSMDFFRAVRKRFDAAGITISAYNLSFNDGFSDEEIDRGFEMARALGAEFITSSSTLSAARRVAPFADKHRMVVAIHGHSNTSDPNEFAGPDSFAAAMKMSKYFKVNLDIGHFTAANFDALTYIRDHHAQITNLHLKDRKKNQGDNVPWGQGDTPIREVLQLLKRERWPIRAHIEYEHRGSGTPIEEVKKCYDFVRQALA